MATSQYTVSACILNWNNLNVIEKTIQRLQEESRNVSLEIIVFDQGSEDGSANYLQSLGDSIKVITSEGNVGSSISRNKMIKAASGEFVLLIDGDILFLKNSLVRMLDFLGNNKDSIGIGFDPLNCYPEAEDKEPEELAVEESHYLILCQYGLYKKSILDQYPFPEFGPFGMPGYGSEDNMVGSALRSNGYDIPYIKNWPYQHRVKTSWNFLDHNYRMANSLQRYILGAYFEHLLDKNQMKHTLINQEITTTKVDIRPYYFKQVSNLGDLGFENLISKYMPFLQFDDESQNVIFPGGTVMHHTQALPPDYNKVIYFGTGISNEREIRYAVKDSKIFTRGPVTQRLLEKHGLSVDDIVVGDTGFLALADGRVDYDRNGKTLVIKDGFSDFNISCDNCDVISVADSDRNSSMNSYVNMDDFREKLKKYSCVHTSQIHPAIFALSWGVPAKLYRKDIRFDDLSEVLRWDLSTIPDDDQMQKIGRRIFSLSRIWTWYFFESLKPLVEQMKFENLDG